MTGTQDRFIAQRTNNFNCWPNESFKGNVTVKLGIIEYDLFSNDALLI